MAYGINAWIILMAGKNTVCNKSVWIRCKHKSHNFDKCTAQ